ncbi:hypothetical protein BCR33DRAFT_830165 [Rhizoclosmatium globosum]|uniref:Uncharacterized protein n=1 Tax=Rhizoclosmatium globosum TaxID=329046 RepID=A0A1Y2BXW3_9FUNG|nr:hypothetical protein BCR33DRAFT_830165 [Rhizoclosmatium globosum]|eukprot:ORY39609.1 hypothetical protein BCR33DRAFT_830165 [Rhizoclosmatium globosum]
MSIRSLAALIERKTFGTPVYVHQFLLKAETKGLLWFEEDENDCGWNWDVTTLDKNIEVSESVLKDMTKRINDLSTEAKKCLKRLRPYNKYTVGFLEGWIIKPIPFSESKGPWKNTILDGLAATPEGAVIEYKEIHDSLSQTARGNNHLKIARIMHSVATTKGLTGCDIEICKHYNLARPLVSDGYELHLIAALNLQAAEHAMSEFDFDNAKELLETGAKILVSQGNPWSSPDSLYFNMNLQLAKYNGTTFKAKSHIYKVFYLQRHLDAMFGDFKTVMSEGLSNLSELGIKVPKTSEECQATVLSLRKECQSILDEKTVVGLMSTPFIANEENDMIQAIILIVSYAASLISNKYFFSCLISIGCHRSLKDGFGRSSSALWTAYPCLHFYNPGGNGVDS